MLSNFTRMEFYRLLKMKSTYICLVAFLVVSILYNGLFMCVKFSKFGINVRNYQQAVSVDISGYVKDGLKTEDIVDPDAESRNDDSAFIGIGLGDYGDAGIEEIFAFTVSKLNALLCLGIVSAFLFGEDYSRKAIKNYNRINMSRHIRLLSKSIVLAVYAAVYHIVTFLASFLSLLMFGSRSLGESMKFANAPVFAGYFFLSYLLTLAFISLVMTATVITRNQIAGLVISIFMSTGALSIIFQALDIIIIQLTGSRPSFSFGMLSVTYDLAETNTFTLADKGNGAVIALIGVIYLISCIFASILSLKKKDYK